MEKDKMDNYDTGTYLDLNTNIATMENLINLVFLQMKAFSNSQLVSTMVHSIKEKSMDKVAILLIIIFAIRVSIDRV